MTTPATALNACGDYVCGDAALVQVAGFAPPASRQDWPLVVLIRASARKVRCNLESNWVELDRYVAVRLGVSLSRPSIVRAIAPRRRGAVPVRAAPLRRTSHTGD